MATNNALDLVLQWPRVPIPLAVDILRTVYEQARAGQQRQSAAADNQPPADSAPADARPDAEQRELPDMSSFLSALTLLRAAQQGVAPEPASYDQVRTRFLDLQTQLRRHKFAIERVVGKTFDAAGASAPPIFQQTLRLQCSRGGRATGRFRCVNRIERPTTVSVASEPFLGDVTGRIDGAVISVTPVTCALDANEQRTFEVDADFSRCPPSDDRQAGASLNVAMDGQTALKVWVAVEFE